MKVNLETSIDNLLYLDYMQQQQDNNELESNDKPKESWCSSCRPKEEKKDQD